jgi:regulatory protein
MSLIITRIESQQKHKNRFSLFNGDNFICGLSEEILLEFNLYPGKEISEQTIDVIKQKEKYVMVREEAWRYLSRREHSYKELKDKLLLKGFESLVVEQILGDLKKKDYVNDERYARQLLQDVISLKKSGPLLIKSKLMKKGIENNLINDLLHELYSPELQENNCRELAGKKLKSLQTLDELHQKKRLNSYLVQKGYTWEICSRVIPLPSEQ